MLLAPVPRPATVTVHAVPERANVALVFWEVLVHHMAPVTKLLLVPPSATLVVAEPTLKGTPLVITTDGVVLVAGMR